MTRYWCSQQTASREGWEVASVCKGQVNPRNTFLLPMCLSQSRIQKCSFWVKVTLVLGCMFQYRHCNYRCKRIHACIVRCCISSSILLGTHQPNMDLLSDRTKLCRFQDDCEYSTHTSMSVRPIKVPRKVITRSTVHIVVIPNLISYESHKNSI